MIKFAQLTIYEGFGYFLPGAVLVAALVVIDRTLWAPSQPLPIFAPSFDLWAVFIVVAYYAGHVVQGAGNMLLDYDAPLQEHLQRNRVWKKITAWVGSLFGQPSADFDDLLVDLAKQKAKKILNSTDELDFVWVRRLAEEAVVQSGVPSELDVYIYREGFYRGSCLSLLVFAVAVWFRAWRGQTQLWFWNKSHDLYPYELVCLGVLCLVAAWIFWRRFDRFGQRHRRAAVLGFLASDKPPQKKQPAGEGN